MNIQELQSLLSNESVPFRVMHHLSLLIPRCSAISSTDSQRSVMAEFSIWAFEWFKVMTMTQCLTRVKPIRPVLMGIAHNHDVAENSA